MAPASQDDFLHCTKIINGLSKCLWRAFVTIFIVYWAGISSDIFLTIFPVISKQLGWLQQSVTCFPHAIFTSLHRVVYPAVHTRKKQCVHGCVHQPKKMCFSLDLICLFPLSHCYTVVWLMGLQRGYGISRAACQSLAPHMWEIKRRCDVNKTLTREALGGLLVFGLVFFFQLTRFLCF